MKSSKLWLLILSALICIFLCLGIIGIKEDYEFTKSESLLIWLNSGLVVFILFKLCGDGCRAEDRQTDYLIHFQGINEFTNKRPRTNEIRQAIKAWKSHREITIQTLLNQKKELDSISVYADYGRAGGLVSESVGGILSVTGIILRAKQLQSAATFIGYGLYFSVTGWIVQGATEILDNHFSGECVTKIDEVLKRDKELSLPLAEWLIYSEKLNADFKAVFGCDLNSPRRPSVLESFSKFIENFSFSEGNEKATGLWSQFCSFLQGNYVTSERLSRLSSALQKNPELLSQAKAICSSLSKSSKDFALREVDAGIALKRKASQNDGSLWNSLCTSGKINQVSFLQAISVAHVAYRLYKLRAHIKEGKSRYSDGLQGIIEGLQLELEYVNSINL